MKETFFCKVESNFYLHCMYLHTRAHFPGYRIYQCHYWKRGRIHNRPHWVSPHLNKRNKGDKRWDEVKPGECPIFHPGIQIHWANFPLRPVFRLGDSGNYDFASFADSYFWWLFDCRISNLSGWILGPKHKSRFHRRNVSHRHTVALIPHRWDRSRICHSLTDRD